MTCIIHKHEGITHKNHKICSHTYKNPAKYIYLQEEEEKKNHKIQ